jgi:hypothetical protein
MGLFNWKKTAVSADEHEQPVFSELPPEHKEFLSTYVQIAEGSGVDHEDPDSVAGFYQTALETWQASGGKTDAELYRNAAGVAFGELLVRTSPLDGSWPRIHRGANWPFIPIETISLCILSMPWRNGGAEVKTASSSRPLPAK